jgi:hypothetical protein
MSKIIFPKACELDVKYREVCVLRVKYQDFSLCIDILHAKCYQSRNSNAAFDLCVFWHVFCWTRSPLNR